MRGVGSLPAGQTWSPHSMADMEEAKSLRCWVGGGGVCVCGGGGGGRAWCTHTPT